MLKKVLDLMAAACLLFDVDWERDFEDDEYVIACRQEKERRPEIRVLRRERVAEAS